jgi:hypothetical protein
MKTLSRIFRRLFSSWHALLAATIALVIYLALPAAVRAYDPTAAVFDGGYLLWVGLATALAFWVIAMAWIMFQIAFASLDRASADDKSEWGGLEQWFNMLGYDAKWRMVQGAYCFCVLVLLICLWLVPM